MPVTQKVKVGSERAESGRSEPQGSHFVTVRVPTKVNADNLEQFARGVELTLAKGRGQFAMQRLVCRLLTGKDTKVAAALAAKWVEWRYGKPTERYEHTGKDGGPVGHTIRFGNGERDEL